MKIEGLTSPPPKSAARRGLKAHEERIPFGDAHLIRNRRGFRPCPWAFEVARFAPVRTTDRVLDLGCGGGVLLHALGQVHGETALRVGVELDGDAADQARRNLVGDPYGPAGIIRGDVRRLPLRPCFQLVVANPPFYPPGWGRQSADGATAAATHALHGGVREFLRAAGEALAPGGQVVVVYDADHLVRLLLAIADAKLTTRRLRFLDDDRGSPARVLALAGRDGAGLTVERLIFDLPNRGAP